MTYMKLSLNIFFVPDNTFTMEQIFLVCYVTLSPVNATSKVRCNNNLIKHPVVRFFDSCKGS